MCSYWAPVREKVATINTTGGTSITIKNDGDENNDMKAENIVVVHHRIN